MKTKIDNEFLPKNAYISTNLSFLQALRTLVVINYYNLLVSENLNWDKCNREDKRSNNNTLKICSKRFQNCRFSIKYIAEIKKDSCT